MFSFARRSIVLGVLMLTASALSVAFTPRNYLALTEATKFDLGSIIPRQFGDWQAEELPTQTFVNPQTKDILDKLYSQTLARSYVNSEGRYIILSLAYGADQSHDNQIHKPEVCYPAQGFLLLKKWNDVVRAGSATLPVMRVVTQHGSRHEPVTYWIRVGDSLIRGAIEQNLARISHGLKGQIPDGMLFRVSEINPDTESSYVLQDQFIRELLSALTPDAHNILVGPHYSEQNRND